MPLHAISTDQAASGDGTVVHGELAGSATALQMPDVPCRKIKFKAQVDNAGDVFIGTSSSVTLAAGTTDVTSGYQLDAGDDTDWLPGPNANVYFRICDNAGDDLTYIAIT